MIFDLAVDFRAAATELPADRPLRRLVELLEEALRRNVHFIVRHPTALFQCCWNLGWWYDCPEVEAHYEVSEDEPAVRPGSGERLYRVLEAWRADRRQRGVRVPWLRELRPPSSRLGSGLVAVLTGHEAQVNDVAYSPDGRWIATASTDRTVRLWDARSGRTRATFVGHEADVWSVSFSSDGAHLLSASSDRTARLWDVSTGAEMQRFMHRDFVVAARFLMDGEWSQRPTTDSRGPGMQNPDVS